MPEDSPIHARLMTAADLFPEMKDRAPIERVHVVAAIRTGKAPKLPEDPKPRAQLRWNGYAAVVAYVSEGRWVASCPSCKGAEIVDPDDPRFLCYSCGNADHDGEWVKCHFPKPDVRELIEQVLARRPRVNRNWLPSQTVGDLLEENEQHGLISPELTKKQLAGSAGLPPGLEVRGVTSLDFSPLLVSPGGQ